MQVGPHLEQARAKQGPFFETKRGACVDAGEPSGFLLRFGGARVQNERSFTRRQHRSAVDVDKSTAQDGVAMNQRVEGDLQGLRLQLARQPQRKADVVGGARWIELLQKPKGNLRQGGPPEDGRCAHGSISSASPRNCTSA